MQKFWKTVKENPGFFVIALVILAVLITQLFVPGNAIYESPWLNRILFVVVAGVAYVWARLMNREKINISKNENLNLIIQVLILGAIVTLAFAILIVWHGGPIKNWL
jgi:hypothetical protein